MIVSIIYLKTFILTVLRELLDLIITMWIEWPFTAKPDYNTCQTLSKIRPSMQCLNNDMVILYFPNQS